MSVQWREFLAALRFVTRRPVVSRDAPQAAGLPPRGALRLVPLAGIVVGLLGAAVYWCAAQLWPTNVAIILSMLATVLVSADVGGSKAGAPYWVFVIFIKYNALMALSAATLPFAMPPHLTLGLILVAGQAASRALAVSVSMAADASAALHATAADLGVALLLGLTPATTLGLPGLIGLVAAIVMRLGVSAWTPGFEPRERACLDITQQSTEASFYLGALAAWKYI